MWHRVAPILAEDFTVICADLSGYGASGKPISISTVVPATSSTPTDTGGDSYGILSGSESEEESTARNGFGMSPLECAL